MRQSQGYHLRAHQVRQHLVIEASPDGPPKRTRQLLGEAIFDQAPVVEEEGVRYNATVVQLKVQELLATEDYPEGAQAIPFAGHLWVQPNDDVNFLVDAIVTVHLPSDAFEALWTAVAESYEVWMQLHDTSPENSPALSLSSDKRNWIALKASGVLTQPKGTTPSTWRELRRAEHLQSVLATLFFEGNGGGQVGTICKELSASLARMEDPKTRCLLLPKVHEMVRSARLAFREPLTGTGNEYFDNAYFLNKPEFEKFIQQFDEKRQAELKRAYNSLWTYCSIQSTLVSGEATAGPAKHGLRCPQDELDSVAMQYCALGDVQSKTLEWALLSALTYAECLGFAQFVQTDDTLAGLFIPQTLKAPSAWQNFKKGVAAWLVATVGEGFYLGVTFGVAWTLTQENLIAAWVVTVGFTLWRWLRKLVLRRELNPKTKYVELLTKMVPVADSFKRYDFNARSVRDLAQAVTVEGAAFSPWVMTLLDRQSNR